jgi:hypothetical protein
MNPTNDICRFAMTLLTPLKVPRHPNVVSDMSDFNSIGGTVRARAADELRDRILTGRLKAGNPRSTSMRSPGSSASAAPRCGRRCSSSPTRVWWRSHPAAGSPCWASRPRMRWTTSRCWPPCRQGGGVGGGDGSPRRIWTPARLARPGGGTPRTSWRPTGAFTGRSTWRRGRPAS